MALYRRINSADTAGDYHKVDNAGFGAFMRKCGFHSQSVSNELRDAIHVVQPTICVSLAHEAFWNEFAGWVYLIGRLYEGDGFDFRNVEPERWAEQCAALNMPYHAFTTPNEPATNEISSEDAKRLDDWCCRFRHRLLELGYEAAGPNVAAGTWHGDAIVRHMPNWCQEATLITLHSYSARAMWDQKPGLERPLPEVPKNEGGQIGWWYIGRYRGWKRAICDRYPWREGKFKMALTEMGVAYGVIDGALGYTKYGDVGWKTDLTEGGYLEGLRWATEFLNQDDYMMGGAIFMVGNGRWGSFETLPLYPVLATFPETCEVEPPPEPEPPSEPEPPEPPPEPPNGGNDMEIKVIDIDRNVLTGQAALDLIAFHGYSFEFPYESLKDGDHYYELVELEEKEGPAAFIFTVLDLDGNPVGGAETAWRWTGFPGDSDDIGDNDYATDWFTTADVGPTKEDGKTGPAMTQDWYTDPNEAGPGQAWIRHPQMWAVLVRGIGMLGSTNHRTLNGTWQEKVFQGEEPPALPLPPPSGTGIAAELDAMGDRLKQIALWLEEADVIAEELASLL